MDNAGGNRANSGTRCNLKMSSVSDLERNTQEAYGSPLIPHICCEGVSVDLIFLQSSEKS